MSGNSYECESSMDNSYLIESIEQTYYPLPIAPFLYGQLILLITLLTGGFLLPVFYKNEEANSTDTFSALVYLHIVIWSFITILTWYVKAEHKTSRIFGYHEFYNSTRHLHRVAFYILSGGNVLMLVASCITHNFCLGGAVTPCGINLDLTPLNYLQIILVIEVALSLPLLTKHIVEVVRFNQNRLPPDVFSGHTITQFEQRELIVGIRGLGNLEMLLHHQADQLMTLNHRNELLQQQLFALAQMQQESR